MKKPMFTGLLMVIMFFSTYAITYAITYATTDEITDEITDAADCSGGWQILSNYSPSQGAPCKLLGLDSRRGVCEEGFAFETLCDDASHGRYRICQGPRRCDKRHHRRGYKRSRHSHHDYRPCLWDFDADRPCPRGWVNRDCSGGCAPDYSRDYDRY